MPPIAGRPSQRNDKPDAGRQSAFRALFGQSQRDAFILLMFGIALLYTNRAFTFIDDEVLILNAAAQPLRFTLGLFLSGAGQHHHPPLYDLLLHFWLLATGGLFDWLRVPSTVLYVGALWVLARAARYWGDDSTSAGLVLIAVLWPYGFHYGRLAGWYSFAFLLISALTWAYLRYCSTPTRSGWLLVCALGGALVYTNYLGWAILALLAFEEWYRHRGDSPTVRRLIASAAVLALIYAPLWRALAHELSQLSLPVHSLRSSVLSAGYNVYVLLVSESVAPWFWRLGIPATVAVAAVFVLAFVSTRDAARRFLLYVAVLIVLMALVGVLETRRLMLAGPWLLLSLATVLATPERPYLRRALTLCLLVVAGFGWYGFFKHSYYAAPRFFEPWSQTATEAALAIHDGAGVVGNNPSFFFYLTYALKDPRTVQPWRFVGSLPNQIHDDNVWSAEDWIAAGHPKRGGMFWVQGMPGPETGTPMAAAADWLDHNCGDRNFRFVMPDPGYQLKQRYFPQLGPLAWRIEVRQYDCRPPAPSAAPNPR